LLENAELSKKYGDDSPLFLKKLAEAEEGREDQIYAGVKLLIANFKGKKIKGEETLRKEWIAYMFFNIYKKNPKYYERDIQRTTDPKAVFDNAN